MEISGGIGVIDIDSDFKDGVIIFGESEFRVHRVAVCRLSPFLSASFKHSTRVRGQHKAFVKVPLTAACAAPCRAMPSHTHIIPNSHRSGSSFTTASRFTHLLSSCTFMGRRYGIGIVSGAQCVCDVLLQLLRRHFFCSSSAFFTTYACRCPSMLPMLRLCLYWPTFS